ncbi:MAG: hypothetical protein K6C99_08120 [Lachnospiraceae bacterium]|nr:hypothetical protein [Lachnospiraceae bacterium]
MIISSGTVSMGAKRSFARESKSGQLFVIKGADSKFEGTSMRFGNVAERMRDGSSLARDMLRHDFKMSVEKRVAEHDEEKALEEIRRKSLRYILEHFYRLFFGRGYEAKNKGVQDNTEVSTESNNMLASYSEYASYEESEQTDFMTTGTVITADGREICFGLSLAMSRSFKEEYLKKTEVYAQNASNAIDPLVINLSGNIASVSDQKVMFDLDADGEPDSISRLNPDSGYLALDINGDGKINDGRELFGTESGDGFADLAKYDEDGNGWIDEADPIFAKLKIFVTDEEGHETLYRLKDKGVGAICLQKVDTDFSLNSLQDNKRNAQIRESGVFLYENGMAGTVQHIDLMR